MPKNTKTLEETLAEQGVEGWYLWRPNQVYTKDPSDSTRYLPTDVFTDRTVEAIISDAEDEGERQILAITNAGESAVNDINQNERQYVLIKRICVNTFLALRNYFQLEDIPAAVVILDRALDGLNHLP